MTTDTHYSISNNQFEIKLNKILDTENIVTILSEEEIKRVVNIVRETYENDKTQSASIMDAMNSYMKLAMQIIEPSSTANQKYNNNIPLILKAAIRFNADAFPALTKDGKIAKFLPAGSDKDIDALDEKGEDLMNEETGEKVVELKGGAKQAKAYRVQKYVNYFLRKKMKKFTNDIDKLTFTYAITGSIFKKTYFNKNTRLPESQLVMPNNVIVNPAAEDMENYPVSEIKFYTQNEMKQKMLSGEFKDYDIESLANGNYEEGDANSNSGSQDVREFADNDTPIRVIEQHCLLDLDGDGYKEPYIVTFDQGNKLLAVQKRFNQKSVRRQTGKDGKIIEIKADVYWTHYRFMPDPRGTFYGLGFGFILHKFNNTLNSCLNQLLKAGYRANMERGLFDKDKLNWGTDKLELKDNQFRAVEVIEGKLGDAFQDFQAKEPSAGLFNLLTFLLDLGKDLSNINDIMSGDFPANASPTTVLAMLQQGSKEFKVVYTRAYNSLEDELDKIYRIIGEHPDLYAEEYLIYLDDPEADFEKDFDLKGIDIMPAADAEIVLDSERVAKANILSQFIGNPTFNQFTLMDRILSLYRIEDIEELLNEPPKKNQPDPQIELMKQQQAIEQAKQENEQNSIKLRNDELQLKAAIARGNVAKQDIEGDKIESDIELNKAKTIETLTKAGKEGSLAEAEALYEPKTNQVNQG